ncbi:MAG TPA: hypothetical protein DCG12_13425 [Planctomycetaceae bacterium]|nr:hypothetical protein [Planctomycetaceae bacterium]
MKRMTPTISALAAVSSLLSTVAADETTQEFNQTRFVTSEHISAPTGLSVSPEGVVFVSCDENGAHGTRRNIGKVIRCEDTDRDGVADQITAYIDHIDSPRGSCFVSGTLYLMQSPFLMAYQDADKDGVAEIKTPLVTQLGNGLRSGPVVHGANGVRMGIDGWLYLAVGDQGCFEATGTDGTKATLRGGGLLRVRPDGSQLSVVATGTRNIYDIAVDPWLNLFARDNTNDGGGWNTRLHHVTELADFGYPHLYRSFQHEIMLPVADYGSGAGTGMYYIHEPGVPGEFADTLLSGDLNTGLAIHPRRSAEASFQIQQESFRNLPAVIDMDMDGSSRLYCASRDGGGFGVATEPFGYVDVIQPSNRRKEVSFPEMSRRSDTELIMSLTSRSQVVRLNAMREIVERGPGKTFSTGLLATAQDSSLPDYVRAAAILTLKQLNGPQSHPVLRKLYPDAAIREFIVRAVGDVTNEFDETAKAICQDGLKDKNPRVHLRAIVGLARSGEADAATDLLPLAAKLRMSAGPADAATQKEEGDWSPPHHAVPLTALKAIVRLDATEILLNSLDNHEFREVALRGLQEIHSPQIVSALSAKIEQTGDRELARLITMALFRLYHKEAPWDGTRWWGHRPNFKGPYYDPVTWKGTAAVRSALKRAFRKVSPTDYARLFELMRLNQIAASELNLDIQFDEVLAYLDKETLTSAEHTKLMNAAADQSRPDDELLQIYKYYQRGPFPDSYHHRVQILRKWGEGRAASKRLRETYAEFVSGSEFIGRINELSPFLKDEHESSYKYAHIQLLSLIKNPPTPRSTREAAMAELEKTWKDQKNIYPHRLRGLMLAFEEVDPTPYEQQLKPLVNHRDERTKQGAARYLKAIAEGQK